MSDKKELILVAIFAVFFATLIAFVPAVAIYFLDYADAHQECTCEKT